MSDVILKRTALSLIRHW